VHPTQNTRSRWRFFILSAFILNIDGRGGNFICDFSRLVAPRSALDAIYSITAIAATKQQSINARNPVIDGQRDT
jgi:hypothetical protein